MELDTPRRLGRQWIVLWRNYWSDIMLLGIAIASSLAIHFLAPTFVRYISNDELLLHLSFPDVRDSVTNWILLSISMAAPLFAILSTQLFNRDYARNFTFTACLGLGHALIATWLVSGSLKKAFGIPRPFFASKCFPDGQLLFDISGNVICSVPLSALTSSRESFPSSTTSLSFAGTTFLTLFLFKFLDWWHPRMSTPALLALPSLPSAYVAILSVSQYRHHWQDVVFGAVFGSFISTIFFKHYTTRPHSASALLDIPYTPVLLHPEVMSPEMHPPIRRFAFPTTESTAPHSVN